MCTGGVSALWPKPHHNRLMKGIEVEEEGEEERS
jgi:hypothetical protein